MSAELSESLEKIRGEGVYNTESFHLEKYVVPGAVAVTLLFIVPWYLLVGRTLEGVDLGASVFAALVLGLRKVRENFGKFNSKVEGLLSADKIDGEALDQAKAILFSLLNPGERSEFAWNLVRWQKMTTFAVLLFLSGIQWVIFSVLAILEAYKENPFVGTFNVSILKDTSPLLWSVTVEVVMGVTAFVAAYYVYKYALIRQIRTNDSYYQFFLKYRQYIVERISSDTISEDTAR